MLQFWPIVRPFLFSMDPEAVHDRVMNWLTLFSRHVSLPNESLPVTYWGLRFPNRVGLAAGFDKNARCLAAWQSLGFGFVEVGTVTALPQAGNPKPRIFRFPEAEALVNCLGFNNDGAEVLAERIGKQRARQSIQIPVGVNIGKSRIVPLEEAHLDYQKSFRILADLADYIVANVSSPNTPGLRLLQEPLFLRKLLETLANENAQRRKPVPLVLKLSSDLSSVAACQAAQLALELGFQALILGNTSTSSERLSEKTPPISGGISGRPLFAKSTQLLADVQAQFAKRLLLIGCGGIMSPADADLKMKAGAELLQVYTGFVYGGPAFAKTLVRSLAAASKT